MNNLSVLIYLADVISGLNVGLAIFSVFSGVFLLASAMRSTYDGYDLFQKPIKWNKWYVSIFITLLLMNTITPSKETVYAIIASESVEEVANSESGKKAVEVLNTWLETKEAELTEK